MAEMTFEEREATFKAREERVDRETAERWPLADELARRFHEIKYRRGQAYYDWDRMQPSYRTGQRETMQFAVELVGDAAVAAALKEEL